MGQKVIIVGGGLAGLSAAIRACERGCEVDLFSMVPVRRSHSVCAQGGINAAVNTKGEGDSPAQHFDDTVYGGDFLADQPLVKEMCEAGPSIIYMLDRMGVPFSRTPEGLLDFRRFGGTLHHRTAYAGATTGQQLLYALDEQVRRFESEGKVKKFENWEMLSLVMDEKRTVWGVTAIHLDTMELQSFKADAVILCTGGPGLIYKRTTNSIINTGSAAAAAYRQGAVYANGEFIQVHPTTIPGEDKLRLMSESVRGEGGRMWVYKDGKPWYFLEERYPKYGNLVPRDVATREIFNVVYDLGLGIDGKPMVYLDISHLDPNYLHHKLGGVIEIYEKFMGVDPKKVPMKVFPGVHYSMGGLYVDSQQKTTLPGLFAAGECEHQYHGANRLGANSLLSCIFGGLRAGDSVFQYVSGLQKGVDAVAESHFTSEFKRQDEQNQFLLKKGGNENVRVLHDELGEIMTAHVTVIRKNENLVKADEKIVELTERYRSIELGDTSGWANAELLFARQFENMLHLARVITLGAFRRNESRGAHYKPDFPNRDDTNWLKTTMAKYTDDGPEFSYQPVDVSLTKPRPRKY